MKYKRRRRRIRRWRCVCDSVFAITCVLLAKRREKEKRGDEHILHRELDSLFLLPKHEEEKRRKERRRKKTKKKRGYKVEEHPTKEKRKERIRRKAKGGKRER